MRNKFMPYCLLGAIVLLCACQGKVTAEGSSNLESEVQDFELFGLKFGDRVDTTIFKRPEYGGLYTSNGVHLWPSKDWEVQQIWVPNLKGYQARNLQRYAKREVGREFQLVEEQGDDTVYVIPYNDYKVLLRGNRDMWEAMIINNPK